MANTASAIKRVRSNNRKRVRNKIVRTRTRTAIRAAREATPEEIRAASLQFVRKLSGFNAPSRTNEAAFNRAVDQVASIASELVSGLRTDTPPRDRAVEAAKARARAAQRFGRAAAG